MGISFYCDRIQERRGLAARTLPSDSFRKESSEDRVDSGYCGPDFRAKEFLGQIRRALPAKSRVGCTSACPTPLARTANPLVGRAQTTQIATVILNFAWERFNCPSGQLWGRVSAHLILVLKSKSFERLLECLTRFFTVVLRSVRGNRSTWRGLACTELPAFHPPTWFECGTCHKQRPRGRR